LYFLGKDDWEGLLRDDPRMVHQKCPVRIRRTHPSSSPFWFAKNSSFHTSLSFSTDMFAHYVARMVSAEMGANVKFESAIVPNWKEGTIQLRNVVINSKRKHEYPPGTETNWMFYDLNIEEIDVMLSLAWLFDGTD
jgi:hypothetical protein